MSPKKVNNKMKQNTDNNASAGHHTEFANEIGAVSSLHIGNFTRDAVRMAEAQLAIETGNDPSADPNSKNK